MVNVVDKLPHGNHGSAEEAGLLLSDSAGDYDCVYSRPSNIEINRRGHFIGFKRNKILTGARIPCALILALIVFVQTISIVHGDIKTSDDLTEEYLYDISDNKQSGILITSDNLKYGDVRSAMKAKATDIEARYEELTDGLKTSTYNYVSGVDYFTEKGHIYPYNTLTDDELDTYEKVLAYEKEKFNLGGGESAPNIVMIMVDDVGWNDLNLGPLSSTMINGDAFPAIDALIKDGGITLNKYISAAICTPARAQFLTGKYSSYIGMDNASNQLPMKEATLAQELRTAGYHTMHVGKWGVGWDAPERGPMARGFDTSFGYYGNQAEKFMKVIDPNDVGKLQVAGYNGSMTDLWDDGLFVGDDSKYYARDQLTSYLPFILWKKGERMLEAAKERKTSDGVMQPFFMYYASDLAHNPYVAPDYYLYRCSDLITPNSMGDDDGYDQKEKLARCAMMLVLDETIGNLTCKLESLGLAENTLFAFASDNGGDVPGDNYPYIGEKFYEVEGGIRTPAAVFGPLVPDHLRGTSYDNLFHVTDWLPTLMNVATCGEWTHSMLGNENILDGVSHWDEIMGTAKEPSTIPRDHALTYFDSEGRTSLLMYQDNKLYHYLSGLKTKAVLEPDQIYTVGDSSIFSCDVNGLNFAGTLSVVSQFFLRSRTAVVSEAYKNTWSTSDFVMLAILAISVAMTFGSLLHRLHAAQKDTYTDGVSKTLSIYGAVSEEEDSLLGT